MMKNRIVSGVLAAWMVFGVFSACLLTVNADENTISIETKEDFIKFANNCTLDSWSQGKTVSLAADIDFSGADFVPVPTFGGTFNGNGYTLLGISCEEKGSYKGVFRYVEQGARISNLNVKAKFILSGSKSFLGGIAGENSGTIESCSFDGNLKGENVIGGIAGNNTDYGQIISCASSGIIVGENSTGGIAGKNSGFIQDCVNNSFVNTVYEEKKTDISKIETDTAAIIESYKNYEEENEEESVLGHTDTGGIAGYTSGIVQGCVNNSAVGYKHIGYNVGGIAGRQAGYILGCQNYGFIQGRKDVGGIVGQAEPYILLNASEGTLHELKSELNTLNSMVNKFIADADNFGDKTKNHLDGISKYAKDAENNAQNLINQGIEFADDNLAEINAQAAILSNTLDKLVPVFDKLEGGGKNLADAVDAFGNTLDNLDLYAPDLKNEIDSIASALSYIAKSERGISNAASKAKKAIGDLEDAVRFNNISKVRKAASELSKAINDIISAKQAIKTSVGEIENILNTKPENFESIGIKAKEIAESLKAVKDNTEIIITSLTNVSSSFDIIISNTKIDFSEFKSAAKNMKSSIGALADAMSYISKGLDDLGRSIADFSKKLDDYTNDISKELSEAKENLSDSLDLLSYAASDITDAVGDIKNIISDLANEEPLEFVKLGGDFRASSEGFFDSLSGISKEIDGLKNTISSEKNKITGDLTSVSNQFNLVLNLLMGEIEEIKNGADSIGDIFVDVSDEDIASARQGKIADSQNSGLVEADRNTGGIAGNIAIEYSKDPEDDIEKPNTLNFTYRTKAILQSCVNEGKITGKKDCVGGIAGKAEIGTIYECENYGDTKSTNGNYVGGVVGKSDSAVRKSYAKKGVSGKRYVGGIAGWGYIITSCYTIVNVKGDENLGAICGDADKNNLHNNFYVNNGIGALDAISYKEKCEEISFDELKNMSDIPSKFISFTVTFVADEKIVETKDIKYGDKTKRIKFPQAPKKDGYFGKWQKIDAETVTENITVVCDYKPYITILSSSEKNEDGKLALALAEGEFTDSAELHITESKEKPPVEKKENIKVYSVSLADTDIKEGDTVTVRLLNENKDRVTAWLLNNGKWERIETSSRGKYAVMRLKGTQNTVCLKYDKTAFGFLWIIFIFMILIAAAVSVAVIIKKRRK